MKAQIDKYMEKYGEDDMPPPCQMFTIENGETGPGGNLHFVQKVFEGAFEVSWPEVGCFVADHSSST